MVDPTRPESALADGKGPSTIERAARRLRSASAPSRKPEPPEQPDNAGAAAGAAATASEAAAEQSLDFAALMKAGFVTPQADYATIAEEFRIVKRPLLLHAFAGDRKLAGNANVVMVTSARPGEGKTFTACNLALSIALEQEVRVLLVDADARHPSVLRVLGLTPRRGLTDLLNRPGVDPASALIRIANLALHTVIGAGAADPRTPELFASQRMGSLLDGLAARDPRRIVIIDTPPALASSEPSVIALHAGQSVVVVEAERTPSRAVQSALALIARCPRIQLVLNKSRLGFGGEEFGNYGYGHAYGQAYRARRTPDPAREPA